MTNSCCQTCVWGRNRSTYFSHVAAERGNPHWKSVPTELLPFSLEERALAVSLGANLG